MEGAAPPTLQETNSDSLPEALGRRAVREGGDHSRRVGVQYLKRQLGTQLGVSKASVQL